MTPTLMVSNSTSSITLVPNYSPYHNNWNKAKNINETNKKYYCSRDGTINKRRFINMRCYPNSNTKRKDTMHLVKMSEVVVDNGPLLGHGGFCNVYRIAEIKNPDFLSHFHKEDSIRNEEVSNKIQERSPSKNCLLQLLPFQHKNPNENTKNSRQENKQPLIGNMDQIEHQPNENDKEIQNNETTFQENHSLHSSSTTDSCTSAVTISTIATSATNHKLMHNYALKILRNDLRQRSHSRGILDLSLEASLLSQMQEHPNIIQLYAVSPHLEQMKTLYADAELLPSEHDPKLQKHFLSNDYFLILELLDDTLDHRIKKWVEEEGDYFDPCANRCFHSHHAIYSIWCYLCYMNVFKGYKKKEKHQRYCMLWLERLVVLRDVACAVLYLHRHGIVYRDLKPSNIGFDTWGNTKLFDFGLAKKIRPDERQLNGLYKMTGNTGSLRYMAPEVALAEPYDHRVDSYSFGMLLWELCSLQPPYKGLSKPMHASLVIQQGYRPNVDRVHWPKCCIDLMERCWSNDMYQRPDFEYIVNVLDEEIKIMHENFLILS